MIDTVFLDAGGVLCHPSWPRVSGALARHGAAVTAASLAAAEPRATHELDQAGVISSTDDRSRGWLFFNLVLRHAGVAQDAGTDAALAELREYHQGENLWEHVEPVVEPGQIWATEEFRQQLQQRPSLWRTGPVPAPSGEDRFNVKKPGNGEPDLWVRLYRLEF